MSFASVSEHGMSGKRDNRLTVTSARHFYQGSNLHTQIQGSTQQSIFRTEHGLLAQRQAHDNRYDVGLICHDAKLSVSRVSKHDTELDVAYAPYGYASSERLMGTLLGFNGELFGHLSGCYLSGNGYRIYSTALMRFGRPDGLSPFGKGGLSSYMYCMGDPVNFIDPTGHFRIGSIFNYLKKFFRSSRHPEQILQENIGYHGTSAGAARKILQKGVKGKVFFATDTYENARHYADLQENGVVLAVSTVNVDKVIANSARGVKKDTGINELKIDKRAHQSLRFSLVSKAGEASDFDRFMTHQERLALTIGQFNAREFRQKR